MVTTQQGWRAPLPVMTPSSILPSITESTVREVLHTHHERLVDELPPLAEQQTVTAIDAVAADIK